MQAHDIFQHADALGITLTLAEDKIRYRPKSAASLEFIERLRANKPTIIDELALLERLRKGQVWLTDCANSFYAGEPTATPAKFSGMLDLWVGLEEQLRVDYQYISCIHGIGKRCPEDVPVICDGCIGIST